MKTVKTVRKTNALKWFIFLFIVCMACTAFATNTVTSTETKKLAEWFFNEIRGNALWDLLKILAYAIFIIVPIVLSLFSQWFHVQLFLKGTVFYVIPKFLTDNSFGVRVKDSDKKAYRKFKSTDREKVSKRLNSNHTVFLVMGPTGVGKRLLTFSEINAKYVLKVKRDKWYVPESENCINKELDGRMKLLVSFFLIPLFWKKSVSIVLMWDNDRTDPSLHHDIHVPSQDRMETIITALSRLLNNKNYRKISFVLPIPAYYQDFYISEDDYGKDNHMPEMLLVNRLNGSECLDLLSAELKYRGANLDSILDLFTADEEKSGMELERLHMIENFGMSANVTKITSRPQYNSNDTEKAEKLRTKLKRLLWIETFGMPAYVTKIASRLQYNSNEAWSALSTWWKQVYDSEEKNPWLAYLYILALKSMVEKTSVNASKLAEAIFGDKNEKKKSVEEAIKRMSVRRRPLSDNDIYQCDACSENEFDLRKVDAEIVFEDPYVIECFINSLGGAAPSVSKTDEIAWGKIFNFADSIPEMMAKVFDLHNSSECNKIAEVYLEICERYLSFADNLKNQYLFLEKLRRVFDDSPLVQAYEQRLNDPRRFQGFVLNMIGRLGAMTYNECVFLFKEINSILLSHNASADYARLIFEMLPLYIISGIFPSAWGIDYQTIIDTMNHSDNDSDVKLKCAAIICVAYGYFKFAREYVIKDLLSIIEPAYDWIINCFDEKNENWKSLKKILSLNKSKVPNFNIKNVSPDVRMAWLCALRYLLIDGRNSLIDGRKEMIVIINERLRDVEFEGTAGLLLKDCRALMPDSVIYNINTSYGIDKIKQGIKNRENMLKQFLDCPRIAINNFMSLCYDYMSFYMNGKSDQLDIKLLNDLFNIIGMWRSSFLTDADYSHVLCWFSGLIYCISDCNKNNFELLKIWPKLDLRFKSFWQDVISKKKIEDQKMSNDYFHTLSNLSNIEAISFSDRESLLNSILPKSHDLLFLFAGREYIDSAWWVYNFNSELVPPHIKMFWCSILLASESPVPWPNFENISETLQEADRFIQIARNNSERVVDEELIQLLYEANGIPIYN